MVQVAGALSDVVRGVVLFLKYLYLYLYGVQFQRPLSSGRIWDDDDLFFNSFGLS